MRWRHYFALAAAAGVSACTTGNVAIRPIAGSGLVATSSSERVNEGRAKLALGSVGLALESFRRALREDPSSVEALVGLAACYQQMGRFDLSSTQYEAALSLAPANADLLERLAASRVAEGKPDLAADIRREAAMRRREQTSDSRLVASGAEVKMPTTAFTQAPHPPTPSAIPPVPQSTAIAPLAIMPTAAAVAALVGQDERLSMSPTIAGPVPMRAPVRDRGPRMVRLSMGEIALVTSPETLWEKPVPKVRMAARPAPIHVLNAARVARLAARTRDNMSRRGWSNVVVGDAPATLATSVIRYPAHARSAAFRLAAQYGYATVADPSVKFITVYLGRDSAGGS